MHEPKDLIERLAAADPLPDAERLTPEQEREAEALLARLLATPTTPAERKRPRRRRALAAAAVAACAAAAFAAVSVLDSGDGGVIDQAVAAVTRGDSVYHVLQRKRPTGAAVTPQAVPVAFVESWHSSDGRMHEKIFAVGGDGRPGRLMDETAGRSPAGRRGADHLRYVPSENRIHAGGLIRGAAADQLPLIDPTGDPGAALRELQERGLLEEAGDVPIRGRSAHRLVSQPIRLADGSGSEYRFEYAVDAETYLPLEQRWSERRGGRTYGFVAEFLVYERLPLDARSRAQLDLDAHRGASCAQGADDPTAKDLGFANPCAGR